MMNTTPTLYQELFGRYKPDKMKKFVSFLQDNPHVFQEFKRLAQKWRESGRSKCSATLIGNVLRWNMSIQTKTDDEFKINNDYFPMLARLLILKDSSFVGFFELR